jgi:hypothetical protein
MTDVKKTYEAIGNFKKMKDEEIEGLVKDCFDGKSKGIRTQDTIVSLREGSNVVDVFTIVRHAIYEKE